MSLRLTSDVSLLVFSNYFIRVSYESSAYQSAPDISRYKFKHHKRENKKEKNIKSKWFLPAKEEDSACTVFLIKDSITC